MLERLESNKPFMANGLAASRLREAAALLEAQGDNRYRVAAYRRAADAVAALNLDLRELLETGGVDGLREIPGVGAVLEHGARA